MIMRIVKDGLCTNCGTCIALCPNEAIKIVIDRKSGVYAPELDEGDCNECGICLEVCPGHRAVPKGLSSELLGEEVEDVLLGNFLDCYVGHSTDHHLRRNSASGGLVTQLLIYALEEGEIDGALVTRMKRDSPLEPEPYIARTRDEIVEASKSIYCPVPANIALRGILQEKGKYAVVGLPCHMRGIRLAEEKSRKLRSRIAIRLGLFCSHCTSFLGTDFWLRKLNVEKRDIKRLSYRGNGWPGGMSIELRDGEKKFLPQHLYWGKVFKTFFIPEYCLLCDDQTCELADVSFGDAWLPEFAHDNVGRSLAVCRAKVAEDLLRSAVKDNVIKLSQISAKKIVRSQAYMLYFKKRNLHARMKLLRRGGLPVADSPSIDIVEQCLALFPCFNARTSRSRLFQAMIQHVPISMMSRYGELFDFVYRRKMKHEWDEFSDN